MEPVDVSKERFSDNISLWLLCHECRKGMPEAETFIVLRGIMRVDEAAHTISETVHI